MFIASYMQLWRVNYMRGGADLLFKDNHSSADTAVAYVMGDLIRTQCFLTKAFLFNTIDGKLPGHHSQRRELLPTGRGGRKQGLKSIWLCTQSCSEAMNSMVCCVKTYYKVILLKWVVVLYNLRLWLGIVGIQFNSLMHRSLKVPPQLFNWVEV